MMIHERTSQIRGFLKECHPVAEANKEYMQLEYEASSHAKKTSAMLRLVQCPFCCKYCFFFCGSDNDMILLFSVTTHQDAE